MIAAINMQWLGVGIAALVVVALLLVVLIRHHGGDGRAASAPPRTFATSPSTPREPAADAAPPLAPLCAVQAASFLDEPLAHGFEGLGKVAAPASSGPFPVDPFGSPEGACPVDEPGVRDWAAGRRRDGAAGRGRDGDRRCHRCAGSGRNELCRSHRNSGVAHSARALRGAGSDAGSRTGRGRRPGPCPTSS